MIQRPPRSPLFPLTTLVRSLPPDVARVFARATVTSAAAHLDASDDEPAELRAQVASPGGITEAALKALTGEGGLEPDRKRTRLNSSHANISYAVFCLKKKRK